MSTDTWLISCRSTRVDWSEEPFTVKSWSGVIVAYLHLSLNPGSDDVGLCGKLAPQPLIGLLSGHLLLEHLVSEGHKVLHLQVEIKEPSPEAGFLRNALRKLTYSVPLSRDVLGGDGGVRVDS